MSKGYVTSGRFLADTDLDAARYYREQARRYLRWGMRRHHREYMRQAIRAWKHYRVSVSRIAA